MTLSGAQLLAALDDATSEVDQVVDMLRRAGEADPADLTLGEGDRRLVHLVEQVTGRPIELTADCPSCGVTNEIALATATLPEHRPQSRWLGVGQGVRAPTYGDLDRLPADPGEAILVLGARCALGAVEPAAAAAALQDIDGSLVGPIGIACVECGAPVEVEADVQHLALRLLRRHTEGVEYEVHLLASRYGWDLATIEALPEERRRRLARLIEGL